MKLLEMGSRLVSRHLLLAIGVSLIIHGWLIDSALFSLPDWLADQDHINVTLAPLPAKLQPAPAPPPKIPKAPAAPKASPKPAPLPAPNPATPAPAAQEGATSAESAAIPAVANDTPAPPSEPVSQAEAPTAAEEAPVPIPPPPRKVEIEFAGFNGGKGAGKQTFERLDDGRYRLTSELSMPVLLFISGSMEQHSEGSITAKGLQPLSFRQKTTGSKAQTANFDWTANQVVLDTGKRVDTLNLPPDTQDFLSFMYQFMFVPPLEEMRMNIVTGKKLKTYIYTFEGEETLSAKFGKLRTWHIGRSTGDGDEKTELWLAVDYRHLPVRIRKTEKDGAAIDLMATRLNILE